MQTSFVSMHLGSNKVELKLESGLNLSLGETAVLKVISGTSFFILLPRLQAFFNKRIFDRRLNCNNSF